MTKKKKKQGSGQLGFIIMPRTTDKPWRGSISHSSIKAVGLGIAVLLMTFIILGYIFSTNLAAVRHVHKLQAETQEKEMALKQVEQAMKKVLGQQQAVSRKQQQVKKLMGIKSENPRSPTSSKGGKGGEDIPVTDGEEADILQQAQEISNSLARQEKELDDMLARINQDTEYFRSLPNQWPAEGEISAVYGLRRSPFGGGESFHNGIDIANYSGVAVSAAGDGTVTFADWKSGYGRMVVIDHGHGLTSEYGHNSALLVEEGERVQKGQQIARMGSTGASTGPHLHFIIMKNGEALDPMIYLP